MHDQSNANSVTLTAIAKNEGDYILEWIAYHFAIGVTKIVVYDNESTDDTWSILKQLSSMRDDFEALAWPSKGLHESPQVEAYSHSLQAVCTDWIMFLDIDEYLVPFRDLTIQRFLSRVPADAASVHINWRGFGSGGRTDRTHRFVTEDFICCSDRAWGNNTHFKSIARTNLVKRVYIHDIETREGRRLLSDLEEFETIYNGLSNRSAHEGIQINHYQCKTFREFEERMSQGDANYHPLHGLKKRDASAERFAQLDENVSVDTSISVFREKHVEEYERLLRCLRVETVEADK